MFRYVWHWILAVVMVSIALIIRANAEPWQNEVDLELILAVDVSQSMDTEEQEIQRAGYVKALTSDEFLKAIEMGPLQKIAITYIEWGGVDEHFVVSEWSVVSDLASAQVVANRIKEAPLRQVQRTSIASLLKRAVVEFQTNGYPANRRVIDVSGDGPNNQGGSVTAVRDEILQADSALTINGLPLMMKDRGFQAFAELDRYYWDCVIGGPNKFSYPVKSRENFANVLKAKLVTEIANLSFPKDSLVQRVQFKEEPVDCSKFD